MSFPSSSKSVRKKCRKRDRVDDDDGLQSFGLFSAMLDSTELTDNSTKANSFIQPVPAGYLSDDDEMMNFSLASLARKVQSAASSNSRNAKKRTHSQRSSSLNRSSSSSLSGKGSSHRSKAKRVKKHSSRQTGISSFFTPRSNEGTRTARRPGRESDLNSSSKSQIQSADNIEEERTFATTQRSLAATRSNDDQQIPSSIISEKSTEFNTAGGSEISVVGHPGRKLVQHSLPTPKNPLSIADEKSKGDEKSNDVSVVPDADVEQKERKFINRKMFGAYNLFNAPTVPPSVTTHPHPKKYNLLWRLHQRSSCNFTRNRSIDGGFDSMTSGVNKKWKENNTIRLSYGQNHSPNANHKITCMEFDSEGVLLAIGDSDGNIRVYDFDEVNARDMATRKVIGDGDKGRQHLNILPFITFKTDNTLRICSVAWDPQNGDKLAVAFANYTEARVYDLSTSSESGPLFVRLLDRRKHRGLGNSSLAYLSSVQTNTNNSNRILVGSRDGILRLWNVPNCGRKQGRLVWAISPWNGRGVSRGGGGNITEILHLSTGSFKENNGLLLVATSIASFALIDMNKCTRKSFATSMNPTPQVLKVWNLTGLRGLKGQKLPTANWMGVKKCFICSDISSELEGPSLVARKSVELLVITNSGWVVNLRFDVSKSVLSSMTAQILHQGPESVKFDSSLQAIIKEKRNKEENPTSLPKFSSVAGSLNKAHSLLVITKVSPTNVYLSSSDKRVLAIMGDNSTKSGPDGLMIINTRSKAFMSDSVFTIPKQLDVKHLAVHPDNQWMVICSAQSSSLSLIRLGRNEV